MSESIWREKVRIFLSSFIKNRTIGDDENIFQQGYVNSLFAMQLVLFIEKEFLLRVENEDMDIKNFSSIDAIVGFVGKKLT